MLRLASGQATEADGAAFRQWCGQSVEHARAFRRPAPPGGAAAAARARRADGARASQGAGAARLPGGALAACGAYLAFRPPLDLAGGELAADYRSGAGEQREVALGEDATVQMNTHTRINVSAQARGEQVDLLAGEVELRAPAGPCRRAPAA